MIFKCSNWKCKTLGHKWTLTRHNPNAIRVRIFECDRCHSKYVNYIKEDEYYESQELPLLFYGQERELLINERNHAATTVEGLTYSVGYALDSLRNLRFAERGHYCDYRKMCDSLYDRLSLCRHDDLEISPYSRVSRENEKLRKELIDKEQEIVKLKNDISRLQST